ncbi:MAG: VTT domain-containing protein [Myxococcota bacterium]
MRSRRPVLLALVIVLVAGAFLRRSLGIEWDAESLQRTIAGFGLWAPLLFVALIGLQFLALIPKLILLPAGGILFGAFAGSIYGAIGLLLGALIKYGIVQWAGPRSLLAGIPRAYLPLVDLGRSNVGTGVVAAASAYPVGPTGLVQIGAAIAGMSLGAFVLAVAAGSLLRASLLATLGTALVEGGRLVPVSLLLLAAALLPLAHPRVRRWLREQSRPDVADS